MAEHLTGDQLVCLDTSVVIALLKGDVNIKAYVDRYASDTNLAKHITSITEYELLRHKDDLKKKIAEEIIETFSVYVLDRNAARMAAKIYAFLERKGQMINENDILIAGTAIANNETLLTRDNRFKNIGNEKIIVI